ncbi:hypothetical protein [Paenibacillus sp. NPDC058071]
MNRNSKAQIRVKRAAGWCDAADGCLKLAWERNDGGCPIGLLLA